MKGKALFTKKFVEWLLDRLIAFPVERYLKTLEFDEDDGSGGA